ncbi:MAG TPA: cyclic nucleotide-binding domain-containing protein, partial [Anaerolineales bacterium]|nr:cyclic nucleotide-binding domain-containing protein [Anaerolineales bacterium]
MPEDRHQIISLLQKIKLFDGLDSTQLDQVAGYIRPITLREGATLHQEGKNHPFFIIVSGEARYTHPIRHDQAQIYVLRPGDFFGADQVLRGKPKLFTLEALSPVLLFSFPVDGLRILLNNLPELTRNIKKQLAWYNLIHSKPFSWLGEEETVKVVCRKHPAYLILVELAPLVVAWIGVVGILFASQLDTASFRLAVGWLGAGAVAGAVFWAAWRFFDWGNDYYIITDQRIVWLERTIGIYDSRQEAPLVAIKSGETKSSFIGRSLGFGDVITQTFVGQVLFRHIANPGEIKNLIDQEHKLAMERQMTTDIHSVEGKIRQKI